MYSYPQCLGSESVGSARFWLPQQNQPITAKRRILLSRPKSELLKKDRFLNSLSSFSIKISKQIENSALLKKICKF